VEGRASWRRRRDGAKEKEGETNLSRVLGEIYPTEHREGEGSSLSSSRLRLTDHVPRPGAPEDEKKRWDSALASSSRRKEELKKTDSRVLQQKRESSLLDFTGLLELHGVNSLQEIRVAEERTGDETRTR